jgi:zinc transport system substrate-binding protein
VIFTLACALFLLPGCRGSNRTDGGNQRIMASFYPIYLMTRNIADGVPGVKVVNLTKPTSGCLHDYTLSPDELVQLETALAFVVNGAGMESFLSRVTERRPGLPAIDSSRGIPPIVDRNGETNAHFWVSVSLAKAQVSNIAEGLARLDPSRAPAYRRNATAYLARLEALRLAMHSSIDPLPNRRIVTFHEAFPYFAREFDLRVEAVVEREPGSEPSAGELADTVALVKKSGIRGLFAEPQYPDGAIRTIAKETGARVYLLDPCVTGPDSSDAYLSSMEANRKVLVEALGR